MEEKHNRKKYMIVIGLAIILIIVIGLMGYIMSCPKVKEVVQIEVGTEGVNIEQFFDKNQRLKDAEFITNIQDIDLKQVGEHEIKIKYKDKEYVSKLEIVDTKPPVVEFQNIEKGLGYEINAEDFIVSKEDASQMEVTTESQVDTSKIGKYNVNITVKDQYDNKTTEECELNICIVKSEYMLELGEKIDLAQLVYDYESHQDVVNLDDIKKIEESGVGEYTLISKYEEKEYETKVIVKDTKGPILELKEMSILPGSKVEDVNQFIQNVSDASEYTINMVTEINYELESQDIVIEAIDQYENKTTQTTKLYITEDKVAPTFSNISSLTVNVNAEVDYNKGVSAKDDRDGEVEITVDSKDVDLTKAGTYYATYTAKDKSGNVATQKRKIIVKGETSTSQSSNNDQNSGSTQSSDNKQQATTGNSGNDVYSKADAVIAKVTNSSMSQTQKVLALVAYFKNQSNLRYSHTYNENNAGGYVKAAEIALNKKTGDCYVHAAVLKLMMDRLGIQNMVVNCTDRSHFWNLIHINGVWRHIDCTPPANKYPNELMTDSKRYDTLQWLHPRDWNRSAYPAAN